jgi:hypothetical protein
MSYVFQVSRHFLHSSFVTNGWIVEVISSVPTARAWQAQSSTRNAAVMKAERPFS